MPLQPGDKLGPYEILAPIGAGGMGEVYKARDPRLKRDVAVKLAAAQFSDRFEREAHAIAALNHSNICQIYDIGPDYLVMEYIEGSPLKGPLPLDRALRYALQICDALDAAHRKGITHRDLKPANILVTKAGIKLLDFGLAKMQSAPGAGDATRTMALTGQGQILGTLFYMSPEQLQGQEADARSDIFSFGLVLYEMLTGKRAFEGSSPASVIAAIMERSAPSIAEIAPPVLDLVLKTCLAKDPADRFQTARDLKRAIEWSVPGDGETPVPRVRDRRQWMRWSLGAAAVLGLAAIALWRFTEKPPAPQASVRFQLAVPEGGNVGTLLNLSPDGRKLAFIANRRLWVHSFGSEESRNLTDARGTPFWSPDSRVVAYANDGKIMRIDATGGPVQTVTDIPGPYGYGGGSWNQDALIVFSNGSALFRVPAAGGTAVRIAEIDMARHEIQTLFPSFLPDGRHFLYTRRARDSTKSAVYLGSVDASPDQETSKPLVNSFWAPAYTPSSDPGIGYMLFMRGETLMAQPFDNRRLELTGQAAPVAEHMGDGRGFSVSANGVLVFERSNGNNRHLTWYGRDGKVLGTAGDPGFYGMLSVSPDGTRAAVTEGSVGQISNIWLLELSSGTSARLVFGSASSFNPVWSPDGSRIIFSSNPNGAFDLYQEPASGAKDAELLLKSDEDKLASSYSPDGRLLLFTQYNTKTNSDIWVLPLDGDQKPLPFLVGQFNEAYARFSPDGRWVAYNSDESGANEVYVRSFSMNAARTAVDPGGKWQVSKGCGNNPKWRSDGRELFYTTCDGFIMAVEIAAGPEFKPGAPQRLGLPQLGGAWGASLDGKRFLALAPDDKPLPYTVVLNWQADLNR